jgi:hypothetical protein
MWVLGLVSGMNWHRSPVKSDGPDAKALLAWIDQYCAAHPLDLVVTAADKLSDEVDSRTH